MRYLLIIVAILGAVFAGCSSKTPPADTVDKAISRFEEGQYNKSRAIVDTLVNDSASFNELSVNSLCRLAQLCLRLDSADAEKAAHVADEGDAVAARCLGRAHTLDADSVDAFINALPREEATRLAVLNRVSTYLTIPRDSLVVESDTIQ